MIVEHEGFKWYVERRDDYHIFNDGEHTVRLLLTELSKYKRIFVDVGVHVGEYSIRMSRFYEKVIAIEPHPRHVKVLRKNIELNGIKNITIIPKGCSDRKEVVYLIDKGGSSTVLDIYNQGEKIEVELDRLDDMVKKADVIKIDVEGYEEKVILGAMRIIESQHPILVIEHHDVGKRFKAHEEIRGMKERISKLLHDYYQLNIDYAHYCYIHKSEDLTRYRFAVMCHWINKCLTNIEEGKNWYHGLPHTWWYGGNLLDFILALPKHISKEKEWFEKI